MRVRTILCGGFFLAFCGCTAVPEAGFASLCDEAVPPPPQSFSPLGAMKMQEEIISNAAVPASRAQRQMTYTATLTINTRDMSGAMKKAQKIANDLGGYAVLMEERTIRLKIPAEAMEKSLEAFESVGVVTSRTMRAEDVTTQLVDLKIRLDNLEKTRLNLQNLLARSGKISDLLAVERELARVSTEIERLEVQQKNLNLRVRYFDLTICFNPVSDPAAIRRMIAIPWVAELGNEVWRDGLPMNRNSEKPFDFVLPEGFVVSGAVRRGDADVLYAMNAEDVVLKFTRRSNLNCAKVDFWSRMIRRSLAFRGFSLEGKDSVAVKNGFVLSETLCASGASSRMYRVAVAVEPDGWLCDGDVLVIECWGPEKNAAGVDFGRLTESAK